MTVESCARVARVATTTGPTLSSADPLSSLFALACGPVSFFGRLGFGHVFALLGRAVKTRPFLVEHMRVCINPDQTVATAGCRRISCCLGASVLRRGTAHSSWTSCGRAFRLEQVAKGEFGRRRCCVGSLGWVTRRRRLGWRSLCFFASAFCFGSGCGRRSRRCCRAGLRFFATALRLWCTGRGLSGRRRRSGFAG